MSRMEAPSLKPDAATSLSPFLAALCLAGSTMIAGLSHLFGFQTDASPPVAILTLVALCIVLRLPAALRARPWLTTPFDALLAVYAILDVSMVFPMQVQAFNLPLVDDAARAFDRSIGFEHMAWMGWLNGHPTVQHVLAVSYRSLAFQGLAIPALCIATGRVRRLDRYVCAFLIALFLTCLVSVLLPTQGIVVILDPALRATLAWPFGATNVVTYDALRSGVLRDLTIDPQMGVISFPSFHAVGAIISCWAFWGWRATRYPALALNAVMTVATVGCGGHYIADVLAGQLLAICSILLAKRGSDLGYAALDWFGDALGRVIPRASIPMLCEHQSEASENN